MLSRYLLATFRMVSNNPLMNTDIFSSSVSTFPQQKIASFSLFGFSSLTSSTTYSMFPRPSRSSVNAEALVQVRRRYWITAGQQIMPQWRDSLLKVVRNYCFPTDTAKNVAKTMNECASNMLRMSVAFTKQDKKSKTQIGSASLNVWFLRVRLTFLL